MNSYLIDPLKFCRSHEILEGYIPVSELKRLVSVCAAPSGQLTWKLAGSFNIRKKSQLKIAISGKIKLICQRCLNPIVFDLDSETIVLLAKNDDEADGIESVIGDAESIEVIVADGKLDIRDLIEDEALLALPLSSKHEICPDSSIEDLKEKRESPFSVLKELKKKE